MLPERSLSFINNPLPSLSDLGLLHALFEESARLRPNAAAVVCTGNAISYEALNWQANRFARYLTSKGIRKGDRVCILLPKSIGMYAAMIGILKMGASYVPLDPVYPAERVQFIVVDSGAKAILTARAFFEKLEGLEAQQIFVEDDEAIIATYDASAVATEGLAPDDEAYVIYTSGTTGKPKGVCVSHGNAQHLVRAEQSIYGVKPDDRMLQGFSIAFDASIEEIWVTFHAGATLVAGTQDIMHAGPETPRLLSDLKITVLSCVPSFLAMFDDDIPSVRILILGGETCIPQLLIPWFSGDRTIYNTYGPTETTVVATLSLCLPGQPVTIGQPLPNYTAYIMDEEGQLLPRGEAGELVIGGLGVTKGYLNRDDLTLQKFIPNTHTALTGDISKRLYRSGDLARMTENGDIEFLGRIDTQVKIRGFRVEIAEIETVLTMLPGIKNAAVIARESSGNVQLDAFVLLSGSKRFSRETAMEELGKKLPPYMIPANIEVLERFPTLANGKIDKNGFPRRKTTLTPETIKTFSSPVKDLIYRIWAKLFQNGDIAENDNFFSDLGGHSLLAAQFVSQLRKDKRWASISMREVYDHPTIGAMAAHLEKKQPEAVTPARAFHPVPQWRYALSAIAQAIGLYVNIAFFAIQWLSPFLTYSYLRAYEYPVWESLITAFLTLSLVYPATLVAGVIIKWVVLGRVREGDHPLWGSYYLRWFFVQKVLDNIPLHFLSGTPLIRIYMRSLGSQLGRNVHIDSHQIFGLDLLSIGDGTSINAEANISCHCIEDGLLKIRRISIGNDVSIGSSAIVALGSSIGDGAIINDLTCVANGMKVNAGERLAGSPAVSVAGPLLAKRSGKRKIHDIFATIFYILCFFLLPAICLLPIFPGIMLLYHFDYVTDTYLYLVVSPIVAVIFVILSALQIIAIKRLVLGRLKPGVYPIRSSFYMRKWLVDKLMEVSLELLGTLYATLYLHPWYRALGVKLGHAAEVSTASTILPDLLAIGNGSFIADYVNLGASTIDGDYIILKSTVIGERTFIGNSAFIPMGSTIGNDCLIGCLTTPPSHRTPDGTAWVGTPAVFLPKRERRDQYFSEQTTYKPGRKLYLQRLLIEFFRVILPPTAFIICTLLLLSLFIQVEDEMELWQAILVFPLIYIALGIGATLVTAVMKYSIVGRYGLCENPLWSTFVWKTELMTGFIEYFTKIFFIEHLTGTAFYPWFLRLMGMKIGKRACIHTTDFTEFDLVTLGDDVALNEDCTIQTHLFEDRVMKMGSIQIGSRVSVGSYTLILYNTVIEDNVKVGDLSLVMKGETLPQGTQWAGSPVRPDGRPQT